MISIIVCSINPNLAAEIKQNIAITIGVPHEVIIFDNKEVNWGLSKVYNHCASKSNFPYLVFVHEDVFFKTSEWGKILIDFAMKNVDVGVIGFAGGRHVPRNFFTWGTLDGNNKREHLFQHYPNGDVKLLNINPLKEDFSQVLTVDGLFIFTLRNIWETIHFDEFTFSGFHFYDADFSLAAALQYKNFICHIVEIHHLSTGSVNQNYCNSISDFRRKWQDRLPLKLEGINKLQAFKEELNSARKTVQTLKKLNVKKAERFQILRNNNSFLFIIILQVFNIILSVYDRN